MAYALEGMEYKTPYGMETMRAEDRQHPAYCSTLTKAGTKGVKYDGKYRFRLEDRHTY